MSHKNKESLVKQVTDNLTAKCRFGESKYEAKKDGTYTDYIYSYSTLHAYTKHAIAFAKWCKANHKCKTVADCREYVNEYLASVTDLSAYTVKLKAAAIAKLYGCSTTDLIPTQPRHRRNITRSRGEAKRDAHFSEKNHAELVSFCRSTGLRRHEMVNLRGDDYAIIDGEMYIHVRKGKGGKERYAKVIGDADIIRRMMDRAENGKVFTNVPGAADIHGYRRDYAKACYNAAARPVETLRGDERYICRGDRKGDVYDRQAMLTVSRSLGHNRVDVIASHYLD